MCIHVQPSLAPLTGKGAYAWTGPMRRAEALEIPSARPSVLSTNSLATASVARFGINESWGMAFTKEVFRHHWLNDVIIGTDEDTHASLVAAGQDPEAALAHTLSEVNRGVLRAQTQQPIELGLFGSPSFVMDGELFWGDDRLEDALKRVSRPALILWLTLVRTTGFEGCRRALR